ncbi:MAG: long-chain fatty acid--CoA ligase [Bacillus thermozeamaize]|uniref:Long-chain fatty acid--CoA ligase n=1 Tax=Bacillus thermozeamaize TaxID=230954 RepID=A0A1Y3P9Z4_9BACI|nr:MAG: long-chain fatty acid--CoA ligase [Bacillus thermozeamaize]
MPFDRHFPFWPSRLPKSLDYPQVPLWDFLETSARRYPHKPAIIYYGNRISYRQLKQEAEQVAAGLAAKGVRKGDRVALYMQNAPQFIIAFYGILRANAMVVPLNPMLLENEIDYMLRDSGAKVIFVGQDLAGRVMAIKDRIRALDVVTVTYRDYLNEEPEIPAPDFVRAPQRTVPGTMSWREFLSSAAQVPELEVGSEDWAVLPYTSGSTGMPKGCIHTHASVIATIVGAAYWNNVAPSAVSLAVLPLFHVTGLQHCMNTPIFVGATIVLLSRWDRDVAAMCIEKYGCTHWVNISTMVVDFLANPKLDQYDLSSLRSVSGGGAPLPEAVGERLFQKLGIRYMEGYGMTETISQTHSNPPDRPKLQCLGVPAPDTDCKVLELGTDRELGPGEEGEIVVSGPQVMKGYWNKPEETEKAFVTIDGKRFLRTGDIGRYDEEGYFFIVDRAKRMINASGFKVWPTEVESVLYKHPAVAEACVVATPDERRGENVKAFVVLRPEYEGKVTEEDIIQWSREQMAAYKYPRVVEFIKELPKSGSGKILWRVLQDREFGREAK